MDTSRLTKAIQQYATLRNVAVAIVLLVLLGLLIRGCAKDDPVKGTFTISKPETQYIYRERVDTVYVDRLITIKSTVKNAEPTRQYDGVFVLDTTAVVDSATIHSTTSFDSKSQRFDQVIDAFVPVKEKIVERHSTEIITQTVPQLVPVESDTSPWTWVGVGSVIGVLVTIAASLGLHIGLR